MIRRFCCCLVLFAGCSNNNRQSATSPLGLDDSRPDVPFVMFQRYGGMNDDFVYGPIVAVWPNGRIVRITSEDAIGKRYVEGILTPSEVEGLLRYITTNERILKLDGGYIMPDSDFERVFIRLKDRRITYGESLPAYPDVRRTAEFTALRRHLMSLELPNARPVAPPWKVPPRDWYEK